MPIYEFYCHKCHTIYQFLSRTVNTKKIPTCPTCRRVKLKRGVSTFATISGKAEGGDLDDGMPPVDDAKLEKAMGMLANEAVGMDEDDPRQAAALMRKLSDATGMPMGPGMEEALRRMEQGEDPEKIEQELGDLLDGEDLFSAEGANKGRPPRAKPRRDETLYEL